MAHRGYDSIDKIMVQRHILSNLPRQAQSDQRGDSGTAGDNQRVKRPKQSRSPQPIYSDNQTGHRSPNGKRKRTHHRENPQQRPIFGARLKLSPICDALPRWCQLPSSVRPSRRNRNPATTRPSILSSALHSAAVLRFLSLEQAMKAVLAYVSPKQPRRTHDLSEIFNALHKRHPAISQTKSSPRPASQ